MTLMAASPIRVGLVGYGMAGRVFHAPLIAAAPGLALIAVASSRAGEVRAALPGVVVHPTPEALFADSGIDLVVIASPTATHAPLAAMALDAGKHVVVDKPFALDLADARALVAQAKAAGRTIAVFQNRRWDGDFLTLRRLIGEGLIGEVSEFESRFDRFRPEVRQRWREDGSAGSGVWFDLGPHLIDQALLLLGRPHAVSADLAALRRGGQSHDHAHVVLHYPHARAVLRAGMVVAGGAPRFLVHGTEGSLAKHGIDPQEAQLGAGMRPGDAGWGIDPEALHHWDGEGRQTALPIDRGAQESFYTALAASLRGEGPAPNDPAEMLAVQEVLEAAIRSSDEGRTVEI